MILIHMILLSIAPISELRGAIAYGVAHGVDPLEASILSAIGNAIVVPILVFVTKPIFSYIKRVKFISPYVKAYEERAITKLKNHKKSKFWGLVLLVGIPIPTTGVYTGVTAGLLLKMRNSEIIIANILGVIMSASIVFLLTIGIIHF